MRAHLLLLVTLLISAAPVAAFGHGPWEHTDRLPAWAHLPSGAFATDVAWTGETVLIAYQRDGVAALARLDPDTGALAPGPFVPSPFVRHLRLAVAGDQVLGFGDGDRIMSFDLATGTSRYWDARLPGIPHVIDAAGAGEHVYILGGPQGAWPDGVVRLNVTSETVEVLPVPYNTNRIGVAAAVDPDGRLLMTGGVGGSNATGCEGYYCRRVVAFDPANGTMDVLPGDLGLDAQHVSAAWHEDHLVVLPHADSLNPRRGTLVRYWPGNGTVLTETNLTLRQVANAVWVDGKALFVSGHGVAMPEVAGVVETYDPRNAPPAPTLRLNVYGRQVQPLWSVNDPDMPQDGRNHIHDLVLDWREGDVRSLWDHHWHTYERSGWRNVTLHVMDEHGETGSVTAPVLANSPPQLNIRPEVENGRLKLEGLSWHDADRDPLNLTIDWGDGTVTHDLFPHQYATNGTFTLRVTVRDVHGAEDQVTREVEVPAWSVAPEVQGGRSTPGATGVLASLTVLAACALTPSRRRSPRS